jgi:hypothetical protein
VGGFLVWLFYIERIAAELGAVSYLFGRRLDVQFRGILTASTHLKECEGWGARRTLMSEMHMLLR